jgi:predicted hydrocarbon binding protein
MKTWARAEVKMIVQEAGRRGGAKGGPRVRELIEEGRAYEMSKALVFSSNFLPGEVIYLKETSRRAQDVYLCPECSKPFEEEVQLRVISMTFMKFV